MKTVIHCAAVEADVLEVDSQSARHVLLEVKRHSPSEVKTGPVGRHTIFLTEQTATVLIQTLARAYGYVGGMAKADDKPFVSLGLAVSDERASAASPMPAALTDAFAEYTNAKQMWPVPFHNAHEGLGVIEEEWDELKRHIFTKQRDRDLPAMRKEAVQLAAMALRFITDVMDEGRGRK